MMPTSSRKLTCRNGHTFSLPASLEDQDIVPCPACTVDVVVVRPSLKSAAPQPLDDAPRGRSLWQLMQRSTSQDVAASNSDLAESPREERSDAARVTSQPKTSPNEDPESGTIRPRGLWALMGGAPPNVVETDQSTNTLQPADRRDTNSDSLASRPEVDASPSVISNDQSNAILSLAPQLADDEDEDGLELDDESSEAARPTATLLGSSRFNSTSLDADVVRRCRRSIVVASLAALMAPLNLLPWLAVKIPGALLGLVAIFLGYHVHRDARRTTVSRKVTTFSMFAIVLGLVGVLAGPAGLNSLGSRWHQAVLQRGATDKLQALGMALDGYYAEHEKYPLGGSVARDAEGTEIGMHGWMTSLLPHLQHAELERQIDFKQSFDHPSNLTAMSQIVPEFLVPHVPHEHNKQGLAVAHFSGVGGQGAGPNGIVNYGIFDRNMSIIRSDVTDGLSQTMIIGEISQQLPAWGDPENWRQIETGLNRHAQGFGNKDGTGAHFLMGDGSVRFFPNHTSRQVLEALSTRDGAEPVTLGIQ